MAVVLWPSCISRYQGIRHQQMHRQGTQELTGTFFCVTATTESFPRTAMLVMPDDLAALKAYSACAASIRLSTPRSGCTWQGDACRMCQHHYMHQQTVDTTFSTSEEALTNLV